MKKRWWFFIGAIPCGIILAHALPLNAQAPQLPTVTAPTNWMGLGIAFGVGVLLVGGIWLMRHNPGSVAKAKAEAEALKNGNATLVQQIAQALNRLTETHAVAVGAIPVALAATPPAAPAVDNALPAGKNGTPGNFLIGVTGDPKLDLPAINAQYFG